MNIIEILGWIGSFLYILSYFLLAFNFILKGKLYFLLNKIAAGFVILVSLSKGTFQPVMINLIWLYISYLGFYSRQVKIKYINKYFLRIAIIFLIIFSFLGYFNFGKSFFFEVLAWLSVFAFSVSYFLYSADQISEKAFHFYNLLAAICLIPKMIMYENYQVVVLEILWGFFALKAYIRNTRNKDYLTLCS